MNDNWTTKEKDLKIAQFIMEEYAQKEQIEALGLFELMVDISEKKMTFQLASWVISLCHQFNAMYGTAKGDWVTRKIISQYIIHDKTLH